MSRSAERDASLLLTTATFGVGLLFRPVGGVLLGIYADRKGRKAALAVHEFANIVLRMARNFHRGFHDIYEPIKGPIERHEAEKKRLESIQQRAKERGDMSQVHTANTMLHGQ